MHDQAVTGQTQGRLPKQAGNHAILGIPGYAKEDSRALKRILAPRYLAYIKGFRGMADHRKQRRFGFLGFSCLPGMPGIMVACFMGFRGLLVVVVMAGIACC